MLRPFTALIAAPLITLIVAQCQPDETPTRAPQPDRQVFKIDTLRIDTAWSEEIYLTY